MSVGKDKMEIMKVVKTIFLGVQSSIDSYSLNPTKTGQIFSIKAFSPRFLD